jgi:hypothetical protein
VNPVRGPASSTCRTASISTVRDLCWCATGNTTGCRSLIKTASTSRHGRRS